MKYQQFQEAETGQGNGLGEVVVSVGYTSRIQSVSTIEVIVVQARDTGNYLQAATIQSQGIII